MGNSRQDRPNIPGLTDADARRLLSPGINRACARIGAHGSPLGPSRVALGIGCDERTVRRARDGESTIGLASAFNLLRVDPSALDEIAGEVGFVLLPKASASGPDAIVASGAVICKLGEIRAREAGAEPDNELASMEAEVEAAELALANLRSRISDYRLRRAA